MAAFGRGKGSQSIRGMSYPCYAALRDRLNVFQGVLAQYRVRATMLAGSELLPTEGVAVTGNCFALLGVKAHLGRTLTPEEPRSRDRGNWSPKLADGRQFITGR